jgi:hypothetical protein
MKHMLPSIPRLYQKHFIPCSVFFCNLKMEAVSSANTSVTTYFTHGIKYHKTVILLELYTCGSSDIYVFGAYLA